MTTPHGSGAAGSRAQRKRLLPSLPSMSRVKLQTWMTIVIVLATVPLFLLSDLALSRVTEARLTQYTEKQMEQTNTAVSTRVSSWLDVNVNVLHQLASFDQITGMDSAVQHPLLEKTIKTFPQLFLLHSITTDGMDLARSDDAALANFAERTWFTEAMAGKDPSWQVLVSKTTGKPSLGVAVPIRDGGGNIIGVLESSSNLDQTAKMLQLGQPDEKAEEGIISFVVDLSGQKKVVIAHPDAKIADATTDVSKSPPVAALLEGKRGAFSYTDDKGVEWNAYIFMLENNWGVITQQPKAKSLAALNELRMMTMVVSLVGTLLMVLLAYFISRWLSGPILELTNKAKAIAAGNLDQRVEIRRGSEIGDLAEAFNMMTVQLRSMLENERAQRAYLQDSVQANLAHLEQVAAGNLSARLPAQPNGRGPQDPMLLLAQSLNAMTESQQQIIAQIRDTASSLSSTSAEILAASAQQASGAAEASAAISQTTITVEEVKAIAEQASERAAEVTSTSQRTVQVSQQGRRAVGDTIESMSQIKERVSGIAENTLALSEQMQQIGAIVSTVSDLAAQSNMLALNASVEAARAGEHGKGFAVVAAEVRVLSEQSRAAAQQIKSILAEIQKAAHATVMATEEGAKGVDRGFLLAAEAQQSIENLSEVILSASQTTQQLTAGGQQQVTGVNQVAIAMQSIQQAAAQSQASARQTERAAQDLNELARKLEEIVGRYKLQ